MNKDLEVENKLNERGEESALRTETCTKVMHVSSAQFL